MACLLMLAPRLALALELGPIEARSALHEPLDARIPVRGAQSGDLEGLDVVLGSPAQFELARVARLPRLDLLEFVVVEQGSGGGYIHVRTNEPVVEPLLTFLIDVDWPRGRTVRGYRLRLSQAGADTAGTGQSHRTAPEAPSASDTATAGTTDTTGTTDTSSTGATDTTPAPSPGSGGIEYGPVGKSETLWSIATRFRPHRSVSIQRMMLAILETNPEAFEFGNINALDAGTILRIPARDEIAPIDPADVIAEVQRQHSAWAEYRKGTRVAPRPSVATPAPTPPATTPTPPATTPTPPATAPTPSATTPAPTPGDSSESIGRIEGASPETAATGREEEAGVEMLRKELALAKEAVDASRRENNELGLQLAEAEDSIEALNRLVELKNQEIAALQTELRVLAEAASRQEVTPTEAESKPTGTSEQAESEPAPAPSEAEPKPLPAPADAESVPTPAEVQPARAEAPTAGEPESLPFGLGALPVNPVFLVGGAGLLLILLGVVALLRRRRTAAGEDDAPAVAEPSPSDGDSLLLELEAVAAELADEKDGPPGRPSRTAAATGPEADMTSGAAQRSAARSEAEDSVEEQIAALWKDDRASDSFDISDLAAEREADSIRSTGRPVGGPDPLRGPHEADATDPEAPASPSTVRAGESVRPDSGTPDGEPDDALRATPDDRVSADSESAVAGTLRAGADWRPVPAAVESIDARSADRDVESIVIEGVGVEGVDDRSVEVEPVPHDGSGGLKSTRDVESIVIEGVGVEGVDDRGVEVEPVPHDGSGGLKSTPYVSVEETADDSEPEAFSFEDLGEDEVQTKIDLAQVYMEMGDAENARGFIEAVLAEGDAKQQDIARKMLSKLA